MSKKIKLLAFCGSLRKDSLNKKLVQQASQAAIEAGAEVKFFDIGEYSLPLYNQEIEDSNGLPENARQIKKLMIESDGFIIASPEYNSSISAPLKNLIDWASRKEGDEESLVAFKEKTALLLAASPGALGGLRGLVHLRSILSNLGMLLLPDQYALSKAHEAFNESAELVSSEVREKLVVLTKKLISLTSRLKAS
ncbi:MAG: NAD(P)H-dependent oxidoreductase [Bdellovibrionales bacterium]|nr:NAD(P)H-dependent oxidoreductase [Bdellovibrionales bacterium]